MSDEAAIPASAPRIGLRPPRDGRLARLAARGDERAFAAIYERYHQELYRYCFAILRNADDAQDALQSTMAAALRSLPGETRPIELRPWLYRVAHNESISLIRKRPADAELGEATVPVDVGADTRAETRERLRELVRDLETLPDRQRGALVMRELSGLSYDQLAAALDMSPAAARQAVYEARVALTELQGGREMECEQVRQAVSDRDGRVLRGRRIRAHLRGCAACQDFQTAIETRSTDLQALCPPLPAAAGAAVLAGILGGGSASAGALAGGAAVGGAGAGILGGGGALAGAGGLKAAAIVAAAVAVGGGAAQMTGAVNLTPGGGDPAKPVKAVHGPASTGASGAAHQAGAQDGVPGTQAPSSGHATGQGSGKGEGRGNDGAKGPPEHSQAGGGDHANQGTAGQDGVAGPPAQSNTGGSGDASHGAPASDGVQGAPGHANTGGNAGSTPADDALQRAQETSSAGGNGNGGSSSWSTETTIDPGSSTGTISGTGKKPVAD